MRKLAIAALLMALMPTQASALSTDDLLGLVAMPLAVAAVANVTGVPADDLGNLVVTLNQANVPPTRFVQVIRYVPVALVAQNDQPGFVQFVREEYTRGVTGDGLVTVIDQRLRTYQVTPEIVTLTEPAPVFVVSDNYIPPLVITRVTELRATPLVTTSFDNNDLLALIAMPLAVNAVANLAGIPVNQLSDFVVTLNQANVAPAQFVEVIRYVPVALVQTDQPSFVEFVRSETARGITGDRLVTVITQRLQTFDVSPQISVTAPARTIVVDENFIPPVVVTRVVKAKEHPHGGPPGQVKKVLGVQTGAEVVHGQKPGRSGREVAKPKQPKVKKAERVQVVPPPMVSSVPPGQAKKVNQPSKKNDGPKAGGPSKGKGKGKGKG